MTRAQGENERVRSGLASGPKRFDAHQLVRRERHAQGVEILSHMPRIRRAGEWHHPNLKAEREDELRRREPPLLRERLQRAEHMRVRGEQREALIPDAVLPTVRAN